MSKKYVIEIKPEYEDSFKGLMLLGAKDSNLLVDVLAVEALEELNSDYINEHYGELQDEAYRKGLEDGKTNNGYQDGVGDAWQTINLIRKMSQHTRETRFGANELGDIMSKYTAKELIAMMRPYFGESVAPHSDRIEVGDEVEWDGDKYVVTYLNYDIETSEITDYDLLAYDGSVIDHVKKYVFTKTGKHYGIASILEAMRK